MRAGLFAASALAALRSTRPLSSPCSVSGVSPTTKAVPITAALLLEPAVDPQAPGWLSAVGRLAPSSRTPLRIVNAVLVSTCFWLTL